MKTVTSATIFHDAIGMRLSMTYSEIDDEGKVISDNKRLDRVITDATQVQNAETVLAYAQTFLHDTEA